MTADKPDDRLRAGWRALLDGLSLENRRRLFDGELIVSGVERVDLGDDVEVIEVDRGARLVPPLWLFDDVLGFDDVEDEDVER